MDFIMGLYAFVVIIIRSSQKLFTYGFTSGRGILFGVVPALALILLWMLLKRAFIGTRELVMLEGTIESNAEIRTTRHGGCVTKATFSLDDKTRFFFKYLLFTKNLWNSINAYGVMETSGKFFGWKQKDCFTVFAFSNSNGTAAFIDDFEKPHSFLRKVYNICLRIGVMLFFPLVFFEDLGRPTDINFYNTLYGKAYGAAHAAGAVRTMQKALVEGAPFAMFFLIIACYSLFMYIRHIRTQPKILQKQLEMLDSAGVKRPLG
jgi:hypothetical protein